MVEATLRIPLVAASRSAIVTFEDNSIIAANRDLLCCDLSEGAVILDLKTGIYYGLDAVGTFIWGLIQSPMHLRDIAAAVLAEYAVEPERCMADLKKIFTEMAELNLIEVTK